MSYRIGEVSKLCGLSHRTLRHYDKLGLLKSSRSESDYRLYSDDDLKRLQQIMFYKTLGFSLNQVSEALDNPCFDYHQSLVDQRAKLVEKIHSSEKVIALIDQTLTTFNEGNTMTSQLFSGFKDFDPEIFEEEVKERWGETDTHQESQRRTQQYTAKDWQTIKQENESLIAHLADLLQANVASDDAKTLQAVDAYRQHIDRWYYPCSKNMFAELGKMYVADPRFTKNFDKVQNGLAQFICDASAANKR